MTQSGNFAHSEQAEKSRRVKATALAAFVWDRGISSSELASLESATLRKLARAADINPPSTSETWTVVGQLLDEKDRWAAENSSHSAAERAHPDEKIMWVKPPIKPW